MKQDRKEKVADLRRKMANLTDEQKAALIERGLIATVDGRLLSGRNTVMIYLQFEGRQSPTVVGGFRQWKAAGRHVLKGEHGSMIWVPSVRKKKDEAKDGEKGESEHEEINFYTATVFDVSQTAEIEQSAAA